MKYLKIISLCLVCIFSLNFDATDKPFKIVIDAGHGGKDMGAVVNSVSEKNIVYAISQRIKALEHHNFEIILLRDDDKFISLKDRVAKINSIQPDLVLSLHIENSSKETKTSTKAYVHKNKQLKKSYYHASKILEHLGQKKQEIEFASFYILRETNSPALNLTLGNLSNEEDILFLTSELGQNYIAEQILKGLQ